jgi:hypothetical protein
VQSAPRALQARHGLPLSHLILLARHQSHARDTCLLVGRIGGSAAAGAALNATGASGLEDALGSEGRVAMLMTVSCDLVSQSHDIQQRRVVYARWTDGIELVMYDSQERNDGQKGKLHSATPHTPEVKLFTYHYPTKILSAELGNGFIDAIDSRLNAWSLASHWAQIGRLQSHVRTSKAPLRRETIQKHDDGRVSRTSDCLTSHEHPYYATAHP